MVAQRRAWGESSLRARTIAPARAEARPLRNRSQNRVCPSMGLKTLNKLQHLDRIQLVIPMVRTLRRKALAPMKQKLTKSC